MDKYNVESNDDGKEKDNDDDDGYSNNNYNRHNNNNNDHNNDDYIDNDNNDDRTSLLQGSRHFLLESYRMTLFGLIERLNGLEVASISIMYLL